VDSFSLFALMPQNASAPVAPAAATLAPSSHLPHTIVETLRSVIHGHQADGQFIGLHIPTFRGNEWAYLKECIDTGWVSSVGKFVDRFEADLAAYCGVERAVAVANGTAALHICLLLSDVQRDDEVLMPALTFIATANAVSYCGAIPHFIDSEETTLGVDPVKLAAHLAAIGERRANGFTYNRTTGRRIKALVPMHAFGHPVDLDALVVICDEWNITLIEDAAESLGSSYKGKHTGNVGRISALSFNGNKVMTTGGGGAILTNDVELGRRAKHLTTTAKVPHRWDFVHDQTGYNYRMPNLNAALGCAQLEQLEGFLAEKRDLAQRYIAAFADVPGVRFVVEPAFGRSNYWLNCLLLDKGQEAQRDLILAATNDVGLMTRPAWELMNRLVMHAHCPTADLSGAESIAARLINIPSSVGL
jgi:perosamine synthetase